MPSLAACSQVMLENPHLDSERTRNPSGSTSVSLSHAPTLYKFPQFGPQHVNFCLGTSLFKYTRIVPSKVLESVAPHLLFSLPVANLNPASQQVITFAEPCLPKLFCCKVCGLCCRQYSGVAHTDTEDEVADLSPSNASPLCESPLLQLASSEVEEDWKLHVSDVMRADSAEHALSTFQLFTRLFEDTSSRLSALTTESCSLLKRPPYIEQLATQICIPCSQSVNGSLCLTIR